MTVETDIPRRRLIPWPLTVRWFATRGWAWGAAIAFLWAAAFLRPSSTDVPEWSPVVMFGSAGITLLWLGFRPEARWVRYAAVAVTVAAAVGRAISLLLVSTNNFGTQLAGTGIWLLVAYWCWLLVMFTSGVPSRR